MKSNNSTIAFEHLGFIGLGNMGGAIALRLLRAGYPLTVLDLDADKMKGAHQEGASAAGYAERSCRALDDGPRVASTR